MQANAWPLLFLFALAPDVFAQGHAGNATLADRLGDLREAYGRSQQAEPTPVTQAAVEGDREPGGEQARLPRIDPRSLLPQPWFGRGESGDGDGAADSRRPQGSTGARLMRDVQRGRLITNDGDIGAAVGKTTTKRVGSALSKPAQEMVSRRDQQPKPSRATAALARSIAEDVAGSLAGDVGDRYAVDPTPEASEQTSPPNAAKEESPEPQPQAPKTESAPTAGSKTTSTTDNQDESASVASEEPSGRLPFTIGGDSQPLPGAARTSTSVSSNQPTTRRRTTRQKSLAIEEQLLVTQKMPVIVSRVSGPRTIIVGREAAYRVKIDNRGDATANQLIAKVTVPEWATLVGTTSSQGRVETPDAYDHSDQQTCQWRMDRLAEGGSATLDLRLIAKTGRPIELGVSWEHAPVDARTVVEVQEPKLAMHLSGPDEVRYGKSQLFRLTVSNPGTGIAEGVRLRLTPPGDESKEIEHSLGSIAAGDNRSVEIELTAREAGALLVAASVSADGGLSADAQKEIFCRKPELAVEWRGPEHRYAGAPATYYFRVRNPGTAVAQRVKLTVELPSGFEATPSPDTPDADSGKLVYRVGTLRPGDDRYFELRGVMRTAGENRLILDAAAEDQTRSETVVATTEVVALADLKLDIQDPRGPIATGNEIAYKIRVTNRGASEAHDVNVVGLFSEGIEPGRAEGGSSQISINDGRVAFGAIDSIPAGASREFTIYARAHEEGTHLFRTEVTCRELEIQLAAEETTRFFEDEPIDIADSESSYRYQR